MAPSDECDECRAITQFLRDVYADAWASSDQTVRNASLAIHKMTGGTEEDAQRAEELLRALPQAESSSARIPVPLSLDNPKYREAIRNMALHFVRTGHIVRAPIRPPG
jgi:hypothetical protein